MRTILVQNPVFANPRRTGGGGMVRMKAKAAPKRRRAANMLIMPAAANPRRRRRRSNPQTFANPIMLANPRRRRRHHHAANPLILPNRRRRRRNPTLSMPLILRTAGIGLAGSGIAFAANAFVIGKLGDDAESPPGTPPTGKGMLLRGTVRVLASVAAAMLAPGSFGAAIGGGMNYPMWAEMYMYWKAHSSAPQEGTEMSLEDVLDGY